MKRPGRPGRARPLLDEMAGQAGRTRLLLRLRKGVEWLTEVHRHLTATDNRDRKLVARFLDALDQWDAMDRMVRDLYGHKGCIFGHGQRCPDDSPVSCRACGEARGPGWVG